ncbi:ABC transporter substrate-binding protein [Marinomonas balearica]|uniref:Putative spermidine/putrescine transport system substrate-binding protein n=1 Tax=Marinomonas balearica TaxID=491947 RepID=A0A4R6M3S6_9GAMM|nr:ABC transporter substrate-binding protein [Marinomonas balearica]TDO95325.1 putative spermidine/putrescine transport system substrate-binding protein [Marinomonas balearica]
MMMNTIRGAIIAAACCAGVTQGYAQESVNFVSWGGSTQDAQKEAWATPFTGKTGIKVIQDGPTDYGKLKAMVESGNVQWDIVDVEVDFAYRAAKEGLLEPLDFSIIDKSNIDPRFVSDYGIGSFYFSFVLAYNMGKISGQPAGWSALFDTETFPGKRALYKWPSPGVIELALLADGVSESDLYPLDLDRAFKKLDTIKKDIIWWGGGAQSQQLLASGEVSMGQFWNGRMFALQEDGIPVGVSWEQNLVMSDFLVIPKGAKNKDAAMKFLAYSTSAQGQADFAELTAFSPINKESDSMISEDLMAFMPTTYADDQVSLDYKYWAEHGPDIAKSWNEWLLK